MSTSQRLLPLLQLMLLFALTACSPAPEPRTIDGNIFGTFFEVTVGAQHVDVDMDALQTGVNEVLAEVDRQMSTYRPDSVLNRLNQAPLNEPIEVEDELFFVLQRSEAIAQQSGGAFDHTVGGLVSLWGFGHEAAITRRPDQDELLRRLDEVGYHFVILDAQNHTAMRTSEVFVDLSGIAKGYGVDAVSAYLSAQNIDNYLVNIGGDIYAKGRRTEEQRWRIGIEAPNDERQILQYVLPLEDVAMVGSGDYRNYFEEDGIRYSHTIDPTTGAPITHHLAAVTVLAENTTDADGYASAIMVLGPERGLQFANQFEIAAILTVREDDGYRSVESDVFSRDFAEQMTVPRVR